MTYEENDKILLQKKLTVIYIVIILAVEAGEVYYMFNTRAMQTNLLFLSIGAYGSVFGLGNAFYIFLPSVKFTFCYFS